MIENSIEWVEQQYKPLDVFKEYGLVPHVLFSPQGESLEVPYAELRIPSPRTDDVYYLRVRDATVVAVYSKQQIVWRQT